MLLLLSTAALDGQRAQILQAITVLPDAGCDVDLIKVVVVVGVVVVVIVVGVMLLLSLLLLFSLLTKPCRSAKCCCSEFMCCRGQLAANYKKSIKRRQ